jgi:hypothetical protein
MNRFSLINKVIITKGDELELSEANSYSNKPAFNLHKDTIIIAYFLKIKIQDKYYPFALFAEYTDKDNGSKITNRDLAEMIYDMHQHLKIFLSEKHNTFFLIPSIDDINSFINFFD